MTIKSITDVTSAEQSDPSNSKSSLISSTQHHEGQNIQKIQTFCLLTITGFIMFYTLITARSFLQPIVVAILLSFALTPVIDRLQRIKVPRILGSALILTTLVGLLVFAVVGVAEPAERWRKNLPEMLQNIEAKFRGFKQSVEEVAKTAEKVEEMTLLSRNREIPQPARVSLTDSILEQGPELLAATGVSLLLLFYLLAYGDKLIRECSLLIEKVTGFRGSLEVAGKVYENVGSYLLTICIINFCLAIVLTMAVYLLGVPHPIFWGALGGLLNFIPYIGPLIATCLLAVSSAFFFNTLPEMITPPIVYYCISAIEGSLITPSLLGKKFTINPVIILVWLLLWTWIWGVSGALISSPLLFSIKLILEELYFDSKSFRRVLNLKSSTVN